MYSIWDLGFRYWNAVGVCVFIQAGGTHSLLKFLLRKRNRYIAYGQTRILIPKSSNFKYSEYTFDIGIPVQYYRHNGCRSFSPSFVNLTRSYFVISNFLFLSVLRDRLKNKACVSKMWSSHCTRRDMHFYTPLDHIAKYQDFHHFLAPKRGWKFAKFQKIVI